MFSGIIKCIGTVESLENNVLQTRATDFPKPSIGSSIAVSGTCLSVVDFNEEGFSFELSSETLRRTKLGELKVGHRVNLEPALSMGDPLDGHLVLGHVDALASVLKREEQEDTTRLEIEMPKKLRHLIAEKGSIAVDGVSLTVGELTESSFSLYLIPLTKQETTLGDIQAGDAVNLEVDCIARYVERQLGILKND